MAQARYHVRGALSLGVLYSIKICFLRRNVWLLYLRIVAVLFVTVVLECFADNRRTTKINRKTLQ